MIYPDTVGVGERVVLMSVSEGTSADVARADSYRAAATAAVSELDEIESAVLALEARIVKLRSRAATLTDLLDVLAHVVPGAASRPGPFAPAPADGDASLLPRRRARDAVPTPLDELPVRLGGGSRPSSAAPPSADDVLGLAGDGRHSAPAARPVDPLDPRWPLPADVERWR